jgi:hypothetical protein
MLETAKTALGRKRRPLPPGKELKGMGRPPPATFSVYRKHILPVWSFPGVERFRSCLPVESARPNGLFSSGRQDRRIVPVYEPMGKLLSTPWCLRRSTIPPVASPPIPTTASSVPCIVLCQVGHHATGRVVQFAQNLLCAPLPRRRSTTGSATFSDASVVNRPVFSRSLSLSKAYDVRSE